MIEIREDKKENVIHTRNGIISFINNNGSLNKRMNNGMWMFLTHMDNILQEAYSIGEKDGRRNERDEILKKGMNYLRCGG